MSRPALALVDTATGEIVKPSRLPDDPKAKKLEELTEENDGLRKSLRSLNGQLNRIKRELADATDSAADADECREFFAWWRTYMDMPKARTDLTTERVKLYRWARKHWTQREVALMCVGIRHDVAFVKHGVKDMKYMLKDEQRAEHFLRVGRRVTGDKEENA